MAYLCVYAALLHDVGSILVDEPQSVEEIEREERHVAQVGAAMLRDLPEFSREECMMMEIAGNLHDIGKLKVQRSIPEKPAHLDVAEYDVIRITRG